MINNYKPLKRHSRENGNLLFEKDDTLHCGFHFSVGIFISNFLFNSILMRKPITGLPVTYKDYFKGNFKTHLVGILGGLIWGLGNLFNLIAVGKAGPAIRTD